VKSAKPLGTWRLVDGILVERMEHGRQATEPGEPAARVARAGRLLYPPGLQHRTGRSLVQHVFRIETANGRHVAVCSCGWRSRALPTAGLAGAAWDQHVADDHDDSD